MIFFNFPSLLKNAFHLKLKKIKNYVKFFFNYKFFLLTNNFNDKQTLKKFKISLRNLNFSFIGYKRKIFKN
jgi:hypothetical protein